MSLRTDLLFVLSLLLTSCSFGQLTIICETDSQLEEISAIEYDFKRKVFWVIEDSGNSNELIALNDSGAVVHQIELKNAKNDDWEDLTKDNDGNLYIGDFGNNDRSRNEYIIYKINETDLDSKKVIAGETRFKLGKGNKEQDFEAFFEYKDHFYLFSKNDQKTTVYEIPNEGGDQDAKKLYSYSLKGKENEITSAAIGPNNGTVVLLNGEKIWKLSRFEGTDFFSGKIEALYFDHSSQKEGVCFWSKREVLITDERKKDVGGYIYSFKLK
jgi:uncharacterized protein YjiK